MSLRTASCSGKRAARPRSSGPRASASPAAPRRQAEMPGGILVLVVGPSGAGKDTLLRLARDALAGDIRFLFPHRHVTRRSDSHEHVEERTPEAFAREKGAGGYA